MTTTLATTLATEINTEHRLATEAAHTAVAHARRCGELLLQAKAEIGHGGFLEWVKQNCQVKERQARTYMKIAENWTAIEAKSAPGADLTIKGAVRLLRGPDSETDKPVDLNCEAARKFSAELRAFERQACREMPELTDEEIKTAYRELAHKIKSGEFPFDQKRPAQQSLPADQERWLKRKLSKSERDYCRAFPTATDENMQQDFKEAFQQFDAKMTAPKTSPQLALFE